jgi:hypothetical protein
MRSGKHLLSFLSIAAFAIMAMSSIVGKNMMTVEKGQVPPDFVGYKGVLLIESQNRSWNNVAKGNFEKYYKGPVQFVQVKDVKTLYPDLTQYRFMLGREIHRTPVMNSYSDRTSESEYIEDRQTGNRYGTYSSGFGGSILKAYSKALEKYRSQQK